MVVFYDAICFFLKIVRGSSDAKLPISSLPECQWDVRGWGGEDNCASLLKTFGLRLLLGENANLEKHGDVFSLIDFLFPEV